MIRASSPTRETRAADAVHRLTGLRAFAVSIDGVRLIGALELDDCEHARRTQQDIGAVTSTGTLHALWLLPAGGGVLASSLPEVKLQRLRAQKGFVVGSDGELRRLYQPPGIVRYIGFAGPRSSLAIERAARFAPIVQRLAIIDGSTPSARNLAIAAASGVGVLKLNDRAHELLLPPSKAVVGRPAVYRWWIAELVYEALLQESTQLVSCDFGFSGPLKPARP
jgi:hypothetical protein